jgi:hypothetical protein
VRRFMTACLAIVALPPAAVGDELGQWFERDLVPYVLDQVTTLPRFRDETLHFVVMVDDRPQSEGTALALQLRDRLRDAVSERPGVRVAWQGDRPGVGLAATKASPDCTSAEADYFIGLELTESRRGQVHVRVRALDIAERSWVNGFAREWQGPVNAVEYRLLRQYVADPTFRGERDAPWQDTEIDLLAAQLAWELGCRLLRQTDAEYVVTGAAPQGDVDAATALVELVTNNLAGIRALQFADDEAANARIGGKAHRIDDDLYQYWITITPTDASSDMTTLSADAYVRIPDEYRAAALVPEASYEFAPGDADLLTQFRVIQLPRQAACPSSRSGYAGSATIGGGFSVDTGECYALEIASSADAVAFFLNHQRNIGLVRLSDRHCGQRSVARIVRSGDQARLPLPLDMLQSGAWTAGDTWTLSPTADVYYVIAATDTQAARALSQHIERLPRRCASSARGGLEGEELERWLDELDSIRSRWDDAIDWRSIRVKDVY